MRFLSAASAATAAFLLLSEPATGALVVRRANLPDPQCHTGVISLKVEGKPQVCCAGYCGECSDYPTCSSVRGQNSTFACCAEEVYNIRCGAGAAANVCLKKCSEAVPPCIMDDGEVSPRRIRRLAPRDQTATRRLQIGVRRRRQLLSRRGSDLEIDSLC